MADVLIHVQHLLGTGHLARATTLARALGAAGIYTVVASGGVPTRIAGDGFELVQLAPARARDAAFDAILDADGRVIDEAWRTRRRVELLDLLARTAPRVVVTELYPFGRRAFAFELDPLIARARAAGAAIISSVRDILVTKRKPGRAEAMRDTALAAYDRVLVHGDAGLVPFARTFPCADEIAHLVRHTGYLVEPPPADDGGTEGRGEVLVSAGGGPVGRALFEAALSARRAGLLADRRWRFLAAPGTWRPDDLPSGVIVEAPRADFRRMLGRAALSISFAGYNTALEAVMAGVPAVLVPFVDGGETEQADRAAAFAEAGLAATIPPGAPTPGALVEAARRALAAGPPARLPDTDGAARSVALVRALMEKRP
jgi:predicted glycosyltransferase